jgi:hypothetical protein
MLSILEHTIGTQLHLSAQGRSWMVGMVIGDVPAKGMQAWGRGTQVVGRNAHN